jgi:hypothetical protein
MKKMKLMFPTKALKMAKLLTALMLSITLLTITATPLTASQLDDYLDIQEFIREQNRRIAELEDEIRNMGTGIVRLVSPQNLNLEAGESREVTITVRNVGTQNVHSLFTVASPSGQSPFTVEFLRNSNNIAQLNANAQRNMTLRITVDENAEAGNHTISLNHYFRNEQGVTDDSSDTINVRIGGTVGTPRLEIRDMNTPSGRINVGQTGQISFEIRNTSTAEARNIRIEATPANEDIIVPMTANRIDIPSLAAGESRRVSFSFMPRDTAETRSYTVGFRVSFEPERGERISFEQSAAFNVFNPDDDENESVARLEIRNMTVPSGRVNVGQTGQISFYLFNGGETEARNIRVEASVPEGANAVVPMTSNIQTVQTLAPGESRRVSFSFSPRDAAVTRSYAVRFNTTFQLERGGETESFEQFASFNVYNPDEDDEIEGRNQIPRVIVSEYSLYPSVPRAGHEFEMTITFRNTNSSRSVNNVRILMEEVMATNLPGQTNNHFAGFTPVGGSNTLFVENLAPRGEVTMVLRFTTSAEAMSGTHNMRISFDYQDQDFAMHEASEQISISVAQVTRLELANVNVMEFASVGSPVWFSFDVINSGRVNLSSIRVRTEGPFDVTDAGGETGRFIGNLNAQRTVGFDGRFVPLEPGQHQGEFIVTGEDTTGAIVELRTPFNIFVEGGWGMDGEFGDWEMDGGFDPGGGMRPGGGMGIVRPGGGGVYIDDGMGGFDNDRNNSGGGSFLRNIFMREVITAPDWWQEDFMGPFNPADAPMMGIEPTYEIRLGVVIGAIAGILAVIAVPVVIIISKKKSKLNFDDDDL